MTYFHMEVRQGSDYEVVFTATDPETQAPLDLSVGYTLTGVIAKTERNGEPHLYDWPVGANGLVGENGKLRIRLLGSITSDWEFERVVYGIKVVNDANQGEVMAIDGPFTLIHTVE